jgi:hypothetical protein
MARKKRSPRCFSTSWKRQVAVVVPVFRDVEPRQFEVAGVHAKDQHSFDDELPEYLLRQEE